MTFLRRALHLLQVAPLLWGCAPGPDASDQEAQKIKSACLRLFGQSPQYRGVLNSTGESNGRTVVFKLESDGTMTLDPDTRRPHCSVRYNWWLDPFVPGLGAVNWISRFDGQRVLVDGAYAKGGLFTAITPRSDGTFYFERHIMADGRRVDSSASLTKVR
jgi:hypothetical protein